MEFIDTLVTKSGKEIKFRYPTINDAQKLTDYINKISKEQTFIIYQGAQETLESETGWLKEKLNDISKKQCIFICAFYNDQLIGSGEIALSQHAESHVGTFGVSLDINFRGDGIGQKLTETIISEAIKNLKSLKIITLEVFGKNKIGQNLYKKMGFIKYGKLPDGIKRKGYFDDAIYMYKKV